jgi:hypothetical protein
VATVSSRLDALTATLPCRAAALAFGAAVFWVYGFRIFLALLNPSNFAHFALGAYLGLAASASIAAALLRNQWLLLFALPAVVLVGLDIVWPRQ